MSRKMSRILFVGMMALNIGFVCACLLTLQFQTANPPVKKLYVLTSATEFHGGNTTTGYERLIEVDAGQNSSRTILELPVHTSEGKFLDYLPESEYQVLYERSNGSSPVTFEDWKKSRGINHQISGLWMTADANILLMMTQNSRCAGMLHDSCYGYYEFTLVKTIDGKTTSLFKLSFHPSLFDTAQAQNYVCDYQVSPDVVPNPTKKVFVLSLTTLTRSCNEVQTYLVDYASQPVAMVSLEAATRFSWSLDGRFLAFVHQGQMNNTIFTWDVEAETPLHRVKTVTATRENWETCWISSNTFLFYERLRMGGDPDLELVAYDVGLQEIVEYYDFLPCGSWIVPVQLRDRQYFSSWREVLWISTGDRTMPATVTRQVVDIMPHDSTFSEYLLLVHCPHLQASGWQPHCFTVLDSDLNRHPFPLSLAQFLRPGEIIVNIIPGSTQ